MVDGKSMPTSIFFIIFLLSLSSHILSKPFQFQTLIPGSLPEPEPLSWSDFQPSLIQTGDDGGEFGDPDTLSLQLRHVDSLRRHDNANATTDHLFNLRLLRDTARVHSISAIATSRTNTTAAVHRGGGRPSIEFSSSIVSGLALGSGEYFTRIGVGTPARYSYMVLDTGSDVVWLQCSPCRKCYTQSDPVFDPTKSSSFGAVTCASPLCRNLDSSGCNRRGNKCTYEVSYGDGSTTVGDFSTETMTFRRIRVKNVALGCGHDNQGLFRGAAGLLGLGRGKLSFPTQAGRRFGQKFSYCLVDRSSSSKPSSIIFGNKAVSRTAVYTPLILNPKLETFYFVGLTGMSVGGTRVRRITPLTFKIDHYGNGGIILDSGTSVTRLIRPAYVAVRDAFRAGASDLKRAPSYSLFDTCFNLSGMKEVRIPTVVMHFNGANVALPASNYMIPVDNKGTFCFAFAETTSGLSIIGNIQQQGFRVVYDVAGSRVGFAQNGC